MIIEGSFNHWFFGRWNVLSNTRGAFQPPCNPPDPRPTGPVQNVTYYPLPRAARAGRAGPARPGGLGRASQGGGGSCRHTFWGVPVCLLAVPPVSVSSFPVSVCGPSFCLRGPGFRLQFPVCVVVWFPFAGPGFRLRGQVSVCVFGQFPFRPSTVPETTSLIGVSGNPMPDGRGRKRD